MKQDPADFRDRLLRAIDAGLARVEAARTFGVHPKTIARWQRERLARGGTAPLPRTGRAPRIDPSQHDRLRGQVAAHPDATLTDHGDRWADEYGVRVSAATMSRLLARLDLPLKKRP
jgi:transposase